MVGSDHQNRHFSLPSFLIPTAIAMSTSSTAARRLLFLHGQFIAPRYYEEHIAVDLFKALRDDGWDCSFVKSPRACPDAPPEILYQMFPEMEAEKDHPEWLNAQTNEADGTKTYLGLDTSLAFLQNYLRTQPHFDVIAGHSNGALMASILSLKMRAEGEAFLPKNKHWSGVLVCNAPASYETETQLAATVIARFGPSVTNLPSVHVFGGPTDWTWEGQQQLQRIHHPHGATIVQHEAGHFFPTGEAGKRCNDQIVAALNAIVPKKS